MRYAWVSGLWKFMSSPSNSSPPHSAILYMYIAMLPGVAIVKILENDLWKNLFLVKLQDLNL